MPVDFLRQAATAGHPFEQFSGLLPEVRLACEKLAAMESHEIVNLRCSRLGSWIKRMQALKADEEHLRSTMSAGRADILSSKRLLLMKELILEESYEDQTLADDLQNGFSLVGDVPVSNILPRKMVPATISVDELASKTEKSNIALRYMTRGCGDPAVDDALWQKTMRSVKAG